MKRTVAFILLLTLILTMPAAAATSPKVKQVLAVAKRQLGTPYALFSNAPRSFNCATFVAYCYNKVARGTITQNGIAVKYKKIKSIKNLKSGDILCFKLANRQKGLLSRHYGIYIGQNRFVHASNVDKKVTVSSLSAYKKRFIGAMRIF